MCSSKTKEATQKGKEQTGSRKPNTRDYMGSLGRWWKWSWMTALYQNGQQQSHAILQQCHPRDRLSPQGPYFHWAMFLTQGQNAQNLAQILISTWLATTCWRGSLPSCSAEDIHACHSRKLSVFPESWRWAHDFPRRGLVTSQRSRSHAPNPETVLLTSSWGLRPAGAVLPCLCLAGVSLHSILILITFDINLYVNFK